jgi:acyl-CoA reductase-like NAD-dependent aldehyde dehydrogenase
MPPLDDEAIRQKIRIAFEERTSGGVRWRQVASESARKELDATPDEIGDLIHQHLVERKKIQQVKETRTEYAHRDFHYDFYIAVASKDVYMETVLTEERMGPVVTVVSLHLA